MFTLPKIALVVVLCAMIASVAAQGAAKLTDQSGHELTKKEAVVKLLKNERVMKCSEQELTSKMTMKAKTDEKE